MIPSMHEHHQAPRSGRAFAIGIGLNLAFVGVEAVYGLGTHSLALLSDAGHNLGDVLSLGLAWGASVLSRRPPSPRRTYGWKRSSILVALANSILLLIAVGAIAVEAVRRFGEPSDVPANTVMLVAGIGVVINTVTALLFLAGQKEDLNIRGAFLHMAADAAVSIGVVGAALLMRIQGWSWIDPAVSLVIALVIIASTWSMLRQSLDLALDAVPKSVDLKAVEEYLAGIEGVLAVHDLHVWGMSTTESALTAHLVIPGGVQEDQFFVETSQTLHERSGIDHTTIQVERSTALCPSGQCLPTFV